MSTRIRKCSRSAFVCLALCLMVLTGLIVRPAPAAADDPVLMNGAFVVMSGDPFRVGGGGAGSPLPIPASPQAQWGMQRVRAGDALAMSNGGQGIVVAVVDTGVTLNHFYLQGHFTTARANFVPGRAADDVSDVADGIVNNGVGHGTFIAGLIRMVAPNALIMPVRVLNGDAVGTDTQVAAGIRFAADNGAHIINLSMGGAKDSKVLHDAIEYAARQHVVVVAAAGNQSLDNLLWPARYSKVISVVATDSDERKAVFSNYGKESDVSAPGVNLYSTYSNGSWIWGTGTSFAAAMVSGEAALVRAAYPDPDPNHIRDRIQHGTVNIKSLNVSPYADKMGKGRIDMYLALQP